MGMTIDEAIKEIESITVVTDEKQALAFALAVHTIKKYQMIQADYENRLKADMVAMLTDIQLELEETAKDAHTNAFMNGYKDMYLNGISASAIKCSEIIQQKIDKLKEAKDGENNY